MERICSLGASYFIYFNWIFYESTRAKLLSFLNYELPLKTWQIIIFIISSYIILKILFKYLTIKSHEQVIKNGTQVILKTNTNPIMIASKFNHKSNEILCTWNFKGEMKEKWISQEALKEYVYTPQITVQRKSNNWLY
jgi:hypothetical protein